MRARRALRCFRLNNLLLLAFFAALFVFWRNGFRERRPEELDPDTRPASAATSTSNGWFSNRGSRKKKGSEDTRIREHPIPRMMREAEEKFNAKVARQSKTLDAAVAEYRRRYNRHPPKGFDDWWEFAKKFDFKMVDEFDILMEDMAPFYELPGIEVRRRVSQVGELPSIDLVRVNKGVVTVQNMQKGFKDSEVSARARGFRSMMGQFVKRLPDMDFPINAKAEGRVLIPWEHQQYPNLTKQDSSGGVDDMLGGPFDPDWGSDGNVWEAWRRTCHPESPSRRLYSSLRDSFVTRASNYLQRSTVTAGDEFGFMEGTAADFDFCKNPHAHYSQGHFFTDWRSIPVLYPVFSPARAKGFMDVRIPSHYYYGSTKGYTYGWDFEKKVLTAVDKMEKPWEEKINKIFWRGATTGGGSHPPGFSPQYQRHRYLRMTSDRSNDTRVVTFNYPQNSTYYTSIEMPISQLNDEIMDAAFVKVSGLYPGGLKALMDHHRFADPVPLGRHWSYKYLVDLDGMSYSGRFLSFLASDSVPIKATVYTEFYSDWIQPWLHFIPLSPSYKEIYNIFAYFSGPTQGMLEAVNSTLALFSPEERYSAQDAELRKIAEAGKQWKKTMGRTLDMEVYVYRLCLEWARLWADDRSVMDYVPKAP
ncbi:hypothetical protein MD484_g4678, partial [Candolleomyces efflorescens]